MRELIVALMLVAAPAAAAPSRSDAAAAGARWIVSKQRPSGAFFSSDEPAPDAAEALASAISGGATPGAATRTLGYIEANGPASVTESAYAARIIMGLVAAHEDPRTFGGFDYVAKLNSYYNPATGAYDTRIYADALAILGVVASRERVSSQAIAYVNANECGNGGFGHDAACGSGADVDTTALVIIALSAAGVQRHDLAQARGWLRSQERSDGGFALASGEAANANSTGLALSAIAALGEDASGWSTGAGKTPLDALRALQKPNGGFAYVASDARPNAYATVQAVPGMAGETYPIRPRAYVEGARIPAPEKRPALSRSPAASSGATPSMSRLEPNTKQRTRTIRVALGSASSKPRRPLAPLWLAGALVAFAGGLLVRVRRA